MRRSLVVVPVVLTTVILVAFWAMADRPVHAREVGYAWEYGSLELVQTGRGTAYVFSWYGPKGNVDTELDVRPLTTAQWPMSTDKAGSSTDAAAARAIARLGREGWELVGESGFARYGSDERVLMFKRTAGAL